MLFRSEERENLPRLFTPGKEVVTYKDADDLTKKLRYYLAHENERKSIAQKGQERTLKEHTYEKRMRELVRILQKSL